MAEAVTSVEWAISEEEATIAGWEAGATEHTEDMDDSVDTEAGTECRSTAVMDMVGHS